MHLLQRRKHAHAQVIPRGYLLLSLIDVSRAGYHLASISLEAARARFQLMYHLDTSRAHSNRADPRAIFRRALGYSPIDQGHQLSRGLIWEILAAIANQNSRCNRCSRFCIVRYVRDVSDHDSHSSSACGLRAAPRSRSKSSQHITATYASIDHICRCSASFDGYSIVQLCLNEFTYQLLMSAAISSPLNQVLSALAALEARRFVLRALGSTQSLQK